MEEWFVVLELSVEGGAAGGAEVGGVRAMLELLEDLDALAICNPDRYALQVRVQAASAVGALSMALMRHAAAAAVVGLDGFTLVRAELLTREELAEEQESFLDSPEASQVLGLGADDGPDPVEVADRALDEVSDEAEARRILVHLVRQLGGGVVAARLQDEWTLPIDLSCGAGASAVAIAEPWSVARMRLEQVLPRLVDKARRRLAKPPFAVPDAAETNGDAAS